MRPQKYRVVLDASTRQQLLDLIHCGHTPARILMRARILLLASEGERDPFIVRALHTSSATVERTRWRFVQKGLERALYERHRSGVQSKLDTKAESFLIALACSEAPQGREHWTMQLLADRLVELGFVESLSDETVRRTLKKTASSPG